MRDDTAAPVKIPEPAGPRCCHNLATMDGVALLKPREALGVPPARALGPLRCDQLRLVRVHSC